MALTYHRKKEEKTQNTADPWKVFGMGFDQEQRPRPAHVTALTGMFSEEQIACFLDGNATQALTLKILREARRNERFAQMLQLAQQLDFDANQLHHAERDMQLNVDLKAATTAGSQLCSLRCEQFILSHSGIDATEQQLIDHATQQGWLHDNGTPVALIGNLLEDNGLNVARTFDNSIETLQEKLAQDILPIAIVDGGELVGNPLMERLEDQFVGTIPDHAVVVTAIDGERQQVEVYDPQSQQPRDTYPYDQFLDAWADSCHYIICASKK